VDERIQLGAHRHGDPVRCISEESEVDATEREWRGVMGALVAGIGHDLNGHVTALKGVAHMARGATRADREMLELLEDQVARMEEAVRLLRTVPLRADESVELASLKDVAEGAVRLWRRRSGMCMALVELEAVGEPPVVLIRRRTLTAGLLLLIAGAEGTGDAPVPVVVRFGEEVGCAWIRIEAAGGAVSNGNGNGNGSRPLPVEARGLLEAAGATMSAGTRDGRHTWEVRMPVGL
jgi:hypothetical protein